MKNREYLISITQEIEQTISNISEEQINYLIKEIKTAKRIFVVGTGRSFLMIKSFAMRLMQIGFEVYVVGEIVTPSITDQDLLIIGSGSGETNSLVSMANRAKSYNAKLALITIYPNSTLGQLADLIVKIDAPTSKNTDSLEEKTLQPGASLFEQSLLILGDAVILNLIETINIEELNHYLMSRHANLE